MSLRKALNHFLRPGLLALTSASFALAWAPPLSAGGVADWVNQRLAEQSKSFEDGHELALEPRTLTRQHTNEHGFAGVRAGSARTGVEQAAPRLALGFELELDRRSHLETDGVASLFGEASRVEVELWLGLPTQARVEAGIGPLLRWSREGSAFLRAGAGAEFTWEASHGAATLEIGNVDLGVAFAGNWFVEASARARTGITLRDSESGSALRMGGGVRLFARPIALDVEWLAPVLRAGESRDPELAFALCSFLGAPSLCTTASRSASSHHDRQSVVRLELRVGWGA